MSRAAGADQLLQCSNAGFGTCAQWWNKPSERPTAASGRLIPRDVFARLVAMPSREEIVDIHNMCACSHIRMASRAVTRFYDEALRSSGLKGTQFVLLAAIEAGEAASITDLAELIDIERTTLVRNLQLLRKEGLVAPEKGMNGRQRPTLTKQGVETLEAALPLWRQAQSEIEERLGYGSWQVTRRRLGELRKAVG